MKTLSNAFLEKLLFCFVFCIPASNSFCMPGNIKYCKVGKANRQKIVAMSVELDPHFLSQNVTRNDGCKIEDWGNIVCHRVKAMNLQRFRVMVLPNWYEPINDNDDSNNINWNKFTWDTPEMKSLYAVLDLAQKQGIHVNLTLWGAPLNHFLAGNNYGMWVVSPIDYNEWAENFSALIQYLVKIKHYTCIDEITPVNEPDWSFVYMGKEVSPEKYIEMCKILDKRFRKDGIRNKVKFSLSDNSDGGSGTHKYLISSVNGLKNISDIFNSHTYIFGYETTNSKIFSWERMNCRLSNSAGKPHFVGEYGSNQTVGATRQKDINLFERGVLMARIAINCLNAGASGLSYWSLFDQYYGKEQSYDQMQQLGLWKSLRSIYSGDTIYGNMKSDYEPRPQYYAYSLLTRFIRSGAEVHPVNLNNEYMAAIAIKNQNGKWVYIFANGDNKEYIVELSNLYGGNGKYGVYKYLKNELPSDDGMLMPQSTVEQSKTIKCKIPENSVIVLAHN